MGKYFKYAIGEILLVMIGILLALQVNNWNENNNNAKKEISYLNNLLNELDTNKEQSESYIDFSKKQYDAANYLSNVINSKIDSVEIVNFVDALIRCYYLPHIIYSKNVWEELKSTGDLSLIQNKKLTQSLSEYFNTLDFPFNLEKEWGLTHIKYRNLVNEIMTFDITKKLLDKRIESKGLDYSIITESSAIVTMDQLEQMVSKLKKTKGLSGLLSDIYTNRRASEFTYEYILTSTNELKNVVKQEIERLK